MLIANLVSTTATFAGIFGILHILFTLRVGLYRRSNRISLGDQGDKVLLKRIRGHGNFVENVPITLLLMLLNELSGMSQFWLIVIGAAFLVARSVHYVTIVSRALPFSARPFSMMTTLLCIAVLAINLII